jgi:hypothetical protein
VLAHHGVVRSGVDLCGRVVERRGEHCNKQCGDNFFHDIVICSFLIVQKDRAGLLFRVKAGALVALTFPMGE